MPEGLRYIPVTHRRTRTRNAYFAGNLRHPPDPGFLRVSAQQFSGLHQRIIPSPAPASAAPILEGGLPEINRWLPQVSTMPRDTAAMLEVAIRDLQTLQSDRQQPERFHIATSRPTEHITRGDPAAGHSPHPCTTAVSATSSGDETAPTRLPGAIALPTALRGPSAGPAEPVAISPWPPWGRSLRAFSSQSCNQGSTRSYCPPALRPRAPLRLPLN